MHLKMAECGLQTIVHIILDLIGLFNASQQSDGNY